jgi:hypothetical protein
MGCDHCTDPNGECCYPYYGLRPHHHDLSHTGSFIGSTVIDWMEPLPKNFEPDPDDPAMGTYTHCPHCGSPVNNPIESDAKS